MAMSLSTSGPPSNTWFLRPIRADKPNGTLIGSAVFAQMSFECPYTLQWVAPFTPQNCPFPLGGSGPLSNTWFPGPTRVLSPNSISIASAVLVGLTSVTETDRPTDHATRSVTIDRIYVRSTVMRPNNGNMSGNSTRFIIHVNINTILNRQ